MSYPNPNYKLDKKHEPIGTGKSKVWYLDARFRVLFRPSAAHDCAYELKDMGFLWHLDSKDADALWQDLFALEIDKLTFWKKYTYKAFAKVAGKLMTSNGRKHWPKHKAFRKEPWESVKLEIDKWWLRAAPSNATREQKSQMIADIKFRYWRYS